MSNALLSHSAQSTRGVLCLICSLAQAAYPAAMWQKSGALLPFLAP
ncbi:hypothetical protein [Myxococcus landrumensis]|uniref:Uncharacterized protein n=1 Tax=Myxococcus landrumensis TaxID=2813577 RepID=A0ABX7NEA5_9BACT|nr:hypothetical protein [Myxococcus landrumus]QSQ17144.1 hypothetical protein JY572_14245 [Myxococcus landrumus]